MLIENQKRKRIPFKSINFSDTRGGVSGFAENWFFWVHTSFKNALDVGHNEYIDKAKTLALRDKKSFELFGLSHDALKREIGNKYSDDKRHKQIMRYAIRYLEETEGSPPLYAFRETDGFESRSGEWYIQIDQASADTEEKEGNVGFKLYGRDIDPQPGSKKWIEKRWLTTSQKDFVLLLRSGRSAVVDLENFE
ncbi:hypothetical protein [Paraburkholderia kururiensis]|uniref:hypothetical protein n=1 Tax=Paraburkholderia kururiensis TaxID=984307 RepID=UPI000F888F9B|nr:hypothetical protein [Paraburkholderia kururiensis]